MTIKLKVKDGASGRMIEMEFKSEITIGDIIIDAADYLDKDSGAYLLKFKKKILTGNMTLADSGITSGSVLELLLDPEGG
jgi:hypothetical protein